VALNVLGLHVGHDSSAAVVVDGRVVADAAEERFSRVKHDGGLPVRAIASCLELAGLALGDLDAVAVASRVEPLPLKDLLARPLPPGEVGARLPRRPLHARRYPLAPGMPVVTVNHHLAHAASAYYTSGASERQLIVTADGIGDGVSVAIWRGEGGRIEALGQFPGTGSLGWFYGNVTEALGWLHGDGEGTTMGLAAYGDPEAAAGVLDGFHPRYEDGALVAPHEFGAIRPWSERGATRWSSPEAPALAELAERLGAEHIAAEAQRVLEEQVLQIAEPWLAREDTRLLSCAGGVFLNVRLNQRLRESAAVDRLHVYPNPGDAGLAAGAALLVCHERAQGTPIAGIRDLYLGPEHSDDEIACLLEARGLASVRHHDVAAQAAERLARGQVVGWFQGRMESGPRALGARSILANPCLAETKRTVNERIKLREEFRPFGPSIAAERAAAYLRRAGSEPYMITAFDVQDDKRAAIPAVVHIDGTVRPQTVERETSPRLHAVIEAFAGLTGEHAVLNTSFNLKGEPIVCHPRDAIRTFYDSGLDCLIMGDHLIDKARA
jgi:carbamoyltransferase